MRQETIGGQMQVEEMRRLPFEKAGAGWLETRKDEIAPKTYREYEKDILLLAKFDKFGQKKLGQITESDVRDYQDRRRQQLFRGKPVGPNSINKELNVLCQMRKYIGKPFAKGAYRPLRKKKSKIGQSLSDVERDHLVYMAQTMARQSPAEYEGIYLFTKFALNTGCGPKEVLGIQLGDIQLSSELGNMVHIRGTKTEGRDRMLALNEEAIEALIEAMARAKRLGATAPDHYLFPLLVQSTKKHDPTKPQVSFRRAWESLRLAANLPTLRMYDMRHDFITRLLSDPDTSEETVEEFVGHLTKSQKKDYSHVRFELKERAVQRMLRRKVGKYERKPAQSVGIDAELAEQIASVIAVTLAQLHKKK